jgi:hypothetical protein
MQLSGGNLESKARSVEVIEELLPLRDTEVSLKLEKPVSKITLEPQGQELEFSQNGDEINLKIDEYSCHQMVVIEY